jgi:hypothetical protein
MPIPASAEHRVVYATYLDAGGDPAVGFVEFTPSVVLTDQADVTFIALEPLVAELDETGYMAADLMCTDDPDLQPTGWYWKVEEHIPGGRRYGILVPSGSTPIPLTALGQAAQVPPSLSQTYVPWAAVGRAGGVPPLDATGLIPPEFLPGTGDLVVFSSSAPTTPAVNQLWWNTATQTLYRWDGSSWVAGTATSDSADMTFTIAGTVSVGTQAIRYYVDGPVSIDRVRVSVGTPPVGAVLTVDVLKNGASIFASPGDRPTIADGGYTAVVTPAGITATTGDYFQISVVTVGSSTAGAGLVTTIRATRTA